MSLKGNAQSLGKTAVKFGPSYKKNIPERGTAIISWILQDKQAQAMNITKKKEKSILVLAPTRQIFSSWVFRLLKW